MPTPPNVVMLCLPQDTPDRRTALADLRAAVCVYAGVAVDDIDPASGYDLSERSYLDSLARWTEHFMVHGPSEWTVRECASARVPARCGRGCAPSI